MSTSANLFGGEGHTRIIKSFLTSDDIAQLKQLAHGITTADKWVRGRQETDYFKYPIIADASLPQGLLQLIDRSLVAMGASPRAQQHFDAYLLHYPNGAHIPEHTDVLDKVKYPSGTHRRFNAIVASAEEGGQLYMGEPQVHIPILDTDAVVFHPDRTKHSVTKITKGSRLVWSVGCIAPSVELPLRDAFLIGVGEVGKRMAEAMTRCGWNVRLVRRNDSEAWSQAADNTTASSALRILAMREEDIAQSLERFRNFPRKDNLLLVQNGFLESIVDPSLLRDVSRGLIYFTSKGSFFSILTASLFYTANKENPAIVDVVASLNATSIAASMIDERNSFTVEMIKKVAWNSIVGLPLHIHKCTLGEYLDNHSEEAKSIISETVTVAVKEYNLPIEDTNKVIQDTWEMILTTTQTLRALKRTGVAVGLVARNAAIEKWGLKHSIPTPVTSKLLAANSQQ